MSVCGENVNLKALKDVQKELDGVMSSGKDQLATLQAKMNVMKLDIAAFMPEIPAIDGIQGALSELGDLANASDLTSKLAELKGKFGDAIPDFDNLISGLGLDSFPPSIDASAICKGMPNVEMVDGAPVEAPKDSKPPKEAPEKPKPKEPMNDDEKKVYWSEICFTTSRNQMWEQFLYEAKNMEPLKSAKRRNKDKYFRALKEIFLYEWSLDQASLLGIDMETRNIYYIPKTDQRYGNALEVAPDGWTGTKAKASWEKWYADVRVVIEKDFLVKESTTLKSIMSFEEASKHKFEKKKATVDKRRADEGV